MLLLDELILLDEILALVRRFMFLGPSNGNVENVNITVNLVVEILVSCFLCRLLHWKSLFLLQLIEFLLQLHILVIDLLNNV